MSNDVNDPGEGHSPAAWTAVVIMLIAFAAGTLFFALDMPVLVWVSLVVLIAGPVVGFIMAKAGYGVKGPKYTPKAHH
jgi:multisubunit Na+/H+ antiporter MnhG subunit